MPKTQARAVRRQLVSLKTAATMLDVHPRTVARWISRGSLRAYRLPGNDLRVDLGDVERIARPVEPGEVSP